MSDNSNDYVFSDTAEMAFPIPGGDTLSVKVLHNVDKEFYEGYTGMEIRFSTVPGRLDFEGSDCLPEDMIEQAAEYFDECAKKLRENKEELAQACYRFTEQAREDLGDKYEWWY